MRFRPTLLLLTAAAVALPGLAVLPARSASATVTDGCLQSVPEPGSSAPVNICFTVYRPAGASARTPVPMIVHSHGWGGSRTKAPTAFKAWLDAGFGVLSFDQRGFGQSGGLAHVQHPDIEGQDVIRIVDFVSRLDWVTQDRRGDPRLGAIGGSYGGGFQFAGALTELRDKGRTRFDALAPDMTWWDVKESLAPQEVPRTGWTAALFAAGARALPQEVHRGFAYSAATGNWPRGQDPAAPNLDAFFEKNGPAWHVSQGRRLDIPALIYQGATDNLFNLNQGLKNFDNALTRRARARSLFVGYNGGHALPSVLPPGSNAAGDPCAARLTGVGGARYEDVALRFMTENLLRKPTGLPGRGLYHLATQAGACLTTGVVSPDSEFRLPAVISTSGAGGPIHTLVAKGPITVAGIPQLRALVTTAGLDTRAFFALAVGTTPADARIVQNNMMPLREPSAVSKASRSIELPGVAVEVPAGQNLYLTVSAVSDMSFAHGARTPGLVALDDATLLLNTRL